MLQQFSASVAPLVSRSKYIKPLLCQGFLFLAKPVSASVARLISRSEHIETIYGGGFCVWYRSPERLMHHEFGQCKRQVTA